MFRLYLVTDRAAVPGGDLVRAVERALAGVPPGTLAVQLREQDLGGRHLLRLAEEVRGVTRAAGVPLLVNDRVDVALAAEADGVHLPEGGLPVAEARRLLGAGRLIGASAHSAEAARAAAEAGADFVVFGPVFATPSKARYGPPQGLGPLGTAARAAGHVPVLAIGGIEPDHALECVRAGAAGVAVIRSAFGAADPAAAVAALLGRLGGNE
ncbi:MAG: thiamine phosphate synthase [Deltaproteobacteria bacterium]|nr:thiamine phosphate synthase [Deltaproteobacteria bacterium]